MNWGRYLGSSVGRKGLMAISGLMLCGFLVVHLIGNIVLLLNDDGTVTLSPGGPLSGEHFMGVVNTYGSIPALLFVLETVLAALFLFHMILGVTLWVQNIQARGDRYVVHKDEGGRTFGSKTMPYTGIFVIGVILIVHLITLRFSGQESSKEMYAQVNRLLVSPGWAALYVFWLLGLMFHLSHGFQSAFQSLGFNHPRHSPRVKFFGWLFALLVLAGFGILPVLFFMKGAMS